MSKHPSTQILPSQSIKHPPIKSYLTLCFSSFSTIRVTLSTNKSALGRESDNITKTAQLRLTPMLRRLFHSGKYLLNNTLMEGRPMYTRMMQKVSVRTGFMHLIQLSSQKPSTLSSWRSAMNLKCMPNTLPCATRAFLKPISSIFNGPALVLLVF